MQQCGALKPKEGFACETRRSKVPKIRTEQQFEVDDIPVCAMCMEKLGTYGGPASLACGHNGCLECLQKVQLHSTDPVCPLCRTPFDAESNLGLNFELRDALQRIQMVSSAAVKYSEEESGHYVLLDSWQTQASSEKVLAQGWHVESSLQEHRTSVSTTQNDRSTTVTPTPPEINLWNLLNGVISILMGRTRCQTDQEICSQDSGEEVVADSGNSWGTVHFPIEPCLLIGPGEDVQALRSILEAEPPQWLPDSASKTCMQCDASFIPLARGRHHCRFCGGIFCRWCSRGKCLLPAKFMERDPQRVCDACYEKLEPVQRNLMNCVSNASQIAIHDVTDLTCMTGWLNSPFGLSMEQEIYKATNTVHNFCKVGRLKPERFIPVAVLQGARGLAMFTVLKAGIMVTYKFGTGLIVARRGDGTWSAPSAIMSCGLGWGAQLIMWYPEDRGPPLDFET